jgi:hypothetical protein
MADRSRQHEGLTDMAGIAAAIAVESAAAAAAFERLCAATFESAAACTRYFAFADLAVSIA